MTEKLAYTVDELSSALGIGRTKIYQLIEAGQFRPVKIGRRTLIPADQVFALLANQSAC